MTAFNAFSRATRPARWWLALLLACWLPLIGAAVQAAPLPASDGAHRHHAVASADAGVGVAVAAAVPIAAGPHHDHAVHAPHHGGDSGAKTGSSCPCHAACAALARSPQWTVAGGVESYRAVEPAPEPGREPAPEPRPPRS